MSVTIVSALPPSHSAPPSNGTESTMASEGGAIGLDFANILFSQKLMNLSVNTGEAGLQEETGDGLAQTEAAEVDTASILATLGLVTQQSAQSADQPAPAPVGSAKSETTAGLAQVGTGIDAEKPIKADTTPLAATADGADGPAKFAVATVATTEKAPATESIAKGDEQARTISTLASHPAATAQRDTPLAVHALAKIVTDGSVQASARVSAASALLKFGRDSIELDDLASRIETLERTEHRKTREIWDD